MNILIYSPSFSPAVGGLEVLTETLAGEFVKKGHAVIIICNTPAGPAPEPSFTFKVFRNIGLWKRIRLMAWCDVYFQPNISLKGLGPKLLLPYKKWVVSHNGWYRRDPVWDASDVMLNEHKKGWQDHLKLFLIRFAKNISVSNAVAKHLPINSVVIPNCYNSSTFYRLPEIKKDLDLVFLGRLVSDKGCSVLLKALIRLQSDQLFPSLSIIGTGEEEQKLKEIVRSNNLSAQVEFKGMLKGKALVESLNRHKIMVVPSLWEEPFGIVALEGMACGCFVVGSAKGGLTEAIGPCGLTFTNGDSEELYHLLLDILKGNIILEDYTKNIHKHLIKHKPETVAEAYLEAFMN